VAGVQHAVVGCRGRHPDRARNAAESVGTKRGRGAVAGEGSVVEEAERGRRAVEPAEPAAEGGAGDEAAPAPCRRARRGRGARAPAAGSGGGPPPRAPPSAAAPACWVRRPARGFGRRRRRRPGWSAGFFLPTAGFLPLGSGKRTNGSYHGIPLNTARIQISNQNR
jgi:hypothetical protein